jgi:small subunit ribosomal protein S5
MDKHNNKTFFKELSMWLLEQEPRTRSRFIDFLQEQKRVPLITEIRKQFIRARIMGANARFHYADAEHRETMYKNIAEKAENFASYTWNHGKHVLKPLWDLQQDEKTMKYTLEPSEQRRMGVKQEDVSIEPLTLKQWLAKSEDIEFQNMEPWIDYRQVFKQDKLKDDRWNNEELYDLPKSITERDVKRPEGIPPKRNRSPAFPAIADTTQVKSSSEDASIPHEEHDLYRDQTDDRDFLDESEYKYSIRARLGGYPVKKDSFHKFDEMLEKLLTPSVNDRSGYAGAGFEFPNYDVEHYKHKIETDDLNPNYETNDNLGFNEAAGSPAKGWWALETEDPENPELGERFRFFGLDKEGMLLKQDADDEEPFSRYDRTQRAEMEKARHTFVETKFEEYTLKMSRNSTMKSKGRSQSFNCLHMVLSRRGFVGVGFGEASTIAAASGHARSAAYRNLRAVETFNGQVVKSRVEAKVGKCIVSIEPSGHNGNSGSYFLRAIAECMGLQGVLVRSVGRKHPMSQIVAFFKCIDQLKTPQWLQNATGKQYEVTDAPVKDYLNHVHGSRGAFGWY